MERRRSPRIDVDIPCTVNLDSGIEVPVRIRNLSTEGLQIQCDGIDSERIAPGGTSLNQGHPIVVEIAFNLLQTRLKLQCRLVFMRRASQDLYILGLHYSDPLQEDLLKLARILPQLR